jgi:hypothetical protein
MILRPALFTLQLFVQPEIIHGRRKELLIYLLLSAVAALAFVIFLHIRHRGDEIEAKAKKRNHR